MSPVVASSVGSAPPSGPWAINGVAMPLSQSTTRLPLVILNPVEAHPGCAAEWHDPREVIRKL